MSSYNNHRSKLSLKRTNSDSTQSILSPCSSIVDNSENDNKIENCNKSLSQDENVSHKSNVEDSLADFKSPKAKTVQRPIFNKFKIEAKKTKKKILTTKSKAIKSIDAAQPTIESSLLKPQISNQNEVKESFPCPLCLKPFKDETTCISHMKTCASKNKVSVQQLLDAKKLQERQAEERKLLGLIAAPVVTEKKKSYRSKNYSTGDDPQLQLVLAISESLYETERQNEFEQAALFAGIPSECIKEMSSEDRRSNLQSFGFISNKQPTENPVKQTKKRKLLGPTILQTRSQEDKERVLTERIACIVTGDDALTQAQLAPSESPAIKNLTPVVLRSSLLRSIERSNSRLWDKSRLTKTTDDYYVQELKSHLWQQKTEERSETRLPSNTEQLSQENQNKDLLNVSVEYEPVDLELLINQKEDSDSPKMTKVENMTSDQDFIENSTANWLQTLNNSAASDIIIFVKNNKHIYAHRLVFYVQCSNVLLTLETNDSLRHPRIKEKLSWLDKDQLSALAFLEFLYCGRISKNINVFHQEELLTDVRALANKYKVDRLISYINMKQKEIESESSKKKEKHQYIKKYNKDLTNENDQSTNETVLNTAVQPIKKITIKSNISYQDYLQRNCIKANKETQTFDTPKIPIEIKSMINQETQTSAFLEQYQTNSQSASNTATLNQEIQKSQQFKTLNSIGEFKTDQNISNNSLFCETPKKLNNRELTFSPDLFDSEDDFGFDNSNLPKKIVNNSTPNIVVDLINDDDVDEEVSVLTQENKKTASRSNSTDVELSSSQKTVIDLCLNAENCKTPLSFTSSEDVHNTINERYVLENESQTANKNHSFKSESNQSHNNKLDIVDDNDYSATTPPHNKTPKVDVSTPHHNMHEESQIDNENFETDDSMYNAVTPPRIEPCEVESKTKTHIDLFINKIQKINAKSAFDSDSESDMSALLPMKPRNPFLKRDNDESYEYLKREGGNWQSRKELSMLEKEILEYEEQTANVRCKGSLKNHQNNQQSFRGLSEKNVNVNNSIQTVDLEEEDLNSQNLLSSVTANNTKNDSSLLTQNEETQIDQISMYSQYKKQNANNSIEKYRNKLNINSIKNFTEHRTLEPNDVTLVSDSDDEVQNYSRLSIQEEHCKINSNSTLEDKEVNDEISTIFSCSSKEIPKNNFIDLGNDSDEQNNFDCNKSYSNHKKGSFKTVEKMNNQISNLNKNDGKERNVVNVSPIAIFSSSDDESDTKKTSAPSKNKSIQKNNSLKDFNDLNKTNYSVNEFIDNERFDDITQNWTMEPEFQTTSKENKSSILNNKSSKSKLSSERKVQAESSSLSNANKSDRRSLQRSSSLETPKHTNDLRRKSQEFEQSMSLKDISALETPDLHRELEKYGLKPQNRKTSKLLLKHIHKELSNESKKRKSSSDDEKPPSKRKSLLDKSKQNSSIVTEEMDCNDSNTPNALEESVSIKDAFDSLLKTNKKLYKKVLIYEPLPLEDLNAMLKQKGFKFKINSLMDYLDEQCIVFQSSKNDTRRKNVRPQL